MIKVEDAISNLKNQILRFEEGTEPDLALKMAIEALEGRKASETEVLRKIQQECNQNLTCTGCRFQGIDEYDFRSCKMHVPACWIIDEQEADE